MKSGTNLSAFSVVLGKEVIAFYHVGDEMLEPVAQKGGGCHIPAASQDQVRQGFAEIGLVQGVSGHSRGFGVGDFERSLPTQSFMIP